MTFVFDRFCNVEKVDLHLSIRHGINTKLDLAVYMTPFG